MRFQSDFATCFRSVAVIGTFLCFCQRLAAKGFLFLGRPCLCPSNAFYFWAVLACIRPRHSTFGPSLRASVQRVLLLGRPSMHDHILEVCDHDILQTIAGILPDLSTLVQLVTKMNWLNFEVKGQVHDEIKGQKSLVQKLTFSATAYWSTFCSWGPSS